MSLFVIWREFPDISYWAGRLLLSLNGMLQFGDHLALVVIIAVLIHDEAEVTVHPLQSLNVEARSYLHSSGQYLLQFVFVDDEFRLLGIQYLHGLLSVQID